jgi:SEC-C motif
MGRHSRLARIHAMKFYSMANALDSFVRVGQDLVDEFVARHDYIGAREVLERNVLPMVIELKMVSRMVPVRSQYAVVLAYCGDHEAAAAEMANLAPYGAGLGAEGQYELREQRGLIARLRREAPPPQWQFPAPLRRMGRNERCYCRSGKKFKRCHGMRS